MVAQLTKIFGEKKYLDLKDFSLPGNMQWSFPNTALWFVGDIRIQNELAKMNRYLCLWVLGQCKIMFLKIQPCCPFFTL